MNLTSDTLNLWLKTIYSATSKVQFFVPDFGKTYPANLPNFKYSCTVEAPLGVALGVMPFHVIVGRVFVGQVRGEATLIVPEGGIHSYSLGLKRVGEGWWVASGTPFALVIPDGSGVSLSIDLPSFAALQRLPGTDELVRL